MPSQYIVVQYGDVMRGEYLNIGVFAYDMDDTVTEVKSQFVADLTRIKNAFGYSDPIMQDLLDGWLRKITTKEELKKLVDSCDSPYTSLQVTAPRGSILTVDELVSQMAKTFLVD